MQAYSTVNMIFIDKAEPTFVVAECLTFYSAEQTHLFIRIMSEDLTLCFWISLLLNYTML